MSPDRSRAEIPAPWPLLAPAFVLVPVVFVPVGFPTGFPAPPPGQEPLYRWAFEQAQAVARPSVLERDLLAVWN